MNELIGGGPLEEIPYLRPFAGADLFARRAGRLADLAPGHAAEEYLSLLSRLAQAQAGAAGRLRLAPRTLPPERPLDVGRRPPPAEWRDVLARILREVEGVPMPAPARQATRALGLAGSAERDSLAGRILSGATAPDDLAAAPFAAAALQATYAVLAASLSRDAVGRARDAACPVCGFPPVAGVVLGDDKLRYLACGLCGAEWHLTRLQCALCRSGAAVSYFSLEGDPGPAKAEACAACRAYTKLLYVEKAPDLEPVADDLASLALDLLVAEDGYARNGRNLFLATAVQE